VSSADFAFDHPLKAVPRSPGKTSASFARRGAPSAGLFGREGMEKFARWLAQLLKTWNAFKRRLNTCYHFATQLGSRAWDEARRDGPCATKFADKTTRHVTDYD
jgi:hypothetical protein